MVNTCAGLFLFISTALLFLTGLSIFSRGFLLTRVSMDGVAAKTSCVQNWTGSHELPSAMSTRGGDDDRSMVGCWLPAKFKRAIIMLIDGLRYDFVVDAAETTTTDGGGGHVNRMPIIHQLLSEAAGEGNVAQRALLYRFVADAPTTTMQRIKALITGGLPTFVDAGRNFASAEINEDNIIDGLVANGKKVVFMGDDTWMGLLPGRFNQAFPYPSFNVWDLHTVDSGVVEHLLPILAATVESEAAGQQPGWDLIIAHFLGVDHCGHTHGPNHPEMLKKLTQMNDIIRLVSESLDNSTVLFVFGDHGMTRTGDHGGDSADEVTSALFIFSKHRPLAVGTKYGLQTKEVSQIDFVVTFSLLMGIPIPFGNLGTVILELFDSKNGEDVSALYLNVKQVDQFLQAYGTVSKDLSSKIHEMSNIKALLDEIDLMWTEHKKNNDKSTSILKSKCTAYLNKVQRLCRDTWAKFDLPLIVTGMAITTIAVFTSYKLTVGQVTTGVGTALSLCGLGILGIAFSQHSTFLPKLQLSQSWDVMISITIAMIQTSVALFFDMATSQKNVRVMKLDLLAIGCVVLNAGLYFSNSYVVSEDSVTSFLFVTLLFCAVLWESSNAIEGEPGKKTRNKLMRLVISPSKVICIGAACIAAICIRMQTVFWKCREEQWWCVESLFLSPSLSSIESDEHKGHRLILGFVAVIMTVMATRWLLRRAGNLNGFSLTIMCASYFPVIMCLGICLYWTMGALSSKVSAHTFSNHISVVPKGVLLTGFLGLFILLIRPFTIYEAPQNAEGIEVTQETGLIVPQVFRHLRSNWQKHLLSPVAAATTTLNSVQQKPLVVYGLATAFSSVLLISIIYVMLAVMLLSSDAYAASFHLLLINIAAVLHCCSSSRHNGSTSFDVSWCWAVIFCLLSSAGFYATGHQPTFASVHWEAAMIGSQETDFVAVPGGQLLPALQIIANTFASTIILGMILPALIVWQSSSCILFSNTNRNNDSGERQNASDRGEFELVDNPAFFDGLIRLSLKYITVQGIRLLASMGAAALHRRHLMVWKIFAPRFLYEAVNFIVSVPAILLGQLLILSVNRALRQWVNQKTP